MTIPVATRKAGPYTGNSSNTSFPFSFKILSSEDIKVTITDATTGIDVVVDPSNYSVSGAGSSTGGVVTYPLSGVPLSTTHKLTVTGNIAIDQEVSIPDNSDFYPAIHEQEFDKLTMILQQHDEAISRCFKAGVASSVSSPDDLIASIQSSASASVSAASSASASATSASASATTAQTAAASVQYINTVVNNFSGNGSNKTFTLSQAPISVYATKVFISGVYQQKATYSVSGTTLTFTSAPPSGTNNVEVLLDCNVVLGVPPNGSVGTQQLSSSVVVPSGWTATTQASGDNSTKLATTAYADNSSASAAALKAALPTSSSGVGQFLSLSVSGAYTYTLPAGGTWLIGGISYNSGNGGAFGTAPFQLLAGGSVYTFGYGSADSLRGFAWRVA